MSEESDVSPWKMLGDVIRDNVPNFERKEFYALFRRCSGKARASSFAEKKGIPAK